MATIGGATAGVAIATEAIGVIETEAVGVTARATGIGTEAVVPNEVNEYVAVGGVARAHDENGNLTDDGTLVFLWDYRNRLVVVALKAGGTPIAQYRYLADNRRSRKVVFDQTQPGVVESETVFLWDGWQCVEERITDTSGGTTTVD